MRLGEHSYQIDLNWTGNTGEGTSTYRSYSRNHEISGPGKPVLPGSSDPTFRGDASRYNPEELLVAALSACHLLSYLHLCAVNKVVVTGYADHATGVMKETDDGGGQMTEVTLRPVVRITAGSDREVALRLHGEAHGLCFIARSVNFAVGHEPLIEVEG